MTELSIKEMKKRYAIVKDRYAGFEIKIKYPFVPFLVSGKFLFMTFVSRRQARQYLIINELNKQ